MTTAIFIGRFQPFHKGHLAAIKEILFENKKVIIGIGSSQESNTRKNPFSAAERRTMIERTMVEEGIPNYEIVEIPDAPADVEWIDEVKSRAQFDSAYTSENIWTRKCFKDAGIPVKFTTFIEPYRGEMIRDKIADKEAWADMVPPPVYNYIQEINGEKRIQDLYTSKD